jgi:hypothetical protein
VPKEKWSAAQDQYAGYDRMYAKVVKNAKAKEADDLRREIETEQLRFQRKRGTQVQQSPNKELIQV